MKITTALQLSTPMKSRFSTVITIANIQTMTVSSIFLYQPTLYISVSQVVVHKLLPVPLLLLVHLTNLSFVKII